VTTVNNLFKTADYTVSYTSGTVHTAPLGYRTGVFQAQLSDGDIIVLQGRVGPEMDFADIITSVNAPIIYEVLLAPEMRVLVANTSGETVVARITG